jgi:hypothetical protein
MAPHLATPELGAMIRAAITYERRRGGVRVLSLAVGDQYGLTTAVAHEMLLFALTATQKPVVVDTSGRMYRVPRSRVRRLLVWAD